MVFKNVLIVDRCVVNVSFYFSKAILSVNWYVLTFCWFEKIKMDKKLGG